MDRYVQSKRKLALLKRELKRREEKKRFEEERRKIIKRIKAVSVITGLLFISFLILY